MNPSPYQEAIFSFAVDPEGGNGTVNAVAGSGKTTTLAWTANYIEAAAKETGVKAPIKVVSFSAEVAKELGRRMPRSADSSTIHSVGKRAWDPGFGIEVAKDKCRRIFQWLQKEKGEIPRWLPPGKVCRLVGLAKAEGLVPEEAKTRDGIEMEGLLPDTEESWRFILDHYGMDTDDRLTPHVLISAARKVLQVSIAWSRKIIDLDDMLYMPTLAKGFPFPRFSWVFVDELQDVSGLQREMILRMVDSGGRFLGVGDRNQAIYGWRGADAQSMDTIAARTGSRELPLSICYRCPRKVVEYAKKIVPHIEAAEGAEEGILEHRETFKASEIEPGHLVICRNRAPVVKLGYKLLGNGVPVRILSGGGSAALVSYLESFRVALVADLLRAVDRDTSRALSHATATEDEEAAQDALDHQETVVAIAEGSRADGVDALLAHVRDLFDGPKEGKVLIGTIHAVKGFEVDTVWFYEPGLIPSRSAKLDWQKEQEKNLMYVGVTRARKALRFIYSGGLR